MSKIYKLLGGRKFLIAVTAIVVTMLNPTLDAKALMSILGLPGLFVAVEGIKDIVAEYKKKNA